MGGLAAVGSLRLFVGIVIEGDSIRCTINECCPDASDVSVCVCSACVVRDVSGGFLCGEPKIKPSQDATHFTGDLKGDVSREPEGTLLTLLRCPWATRGILSCSRGVVADRMR